MFRRDADDVDRLRDSTSLAGTVLEAGMLDLAIGASAGPLLVMSVLLLLLVVIHSATRKRGSWQDMPPVDQGRRAGHREPAHSAPRDGPPSRAASRRGN